MDVSGFGFGEEDLAELAKALGMLYELGYDREAVCYFENKSRTVNAWVKFRKPGSKRYAVIAAGRNKHTKRFAIAVVLPGGAVRLSRKDIEQVKAGAADRAVAEILKGCVVKVSSKRRLQIPASSSVEELKLKMAVAGGNV